ncbi:MAG TPA: hypothetical protein VD995_20190 [Azospirillum sp.]|nr:hypothetical protein [Azospirillum sp.]
MPAPAMLLSALGALLCAVAIGVAPAMAAEGGGGGKCPWQQEATLVLDAKTIHVPPTVFETKGAPAMIDGFELLPNLNALVLRIHGPHGEIWEAALTRVGEKRCTGFYVAKPVLIAEPPPFVPRSSKSSVAVR